MPQVKECMLSKTNKYTKEVRQTLAYAREEAIRLRHRTVGSEHLLLGMLRLNDPLIEGLFGARRLTTLRVYQALEFVVGRGNKAILSEPVFNVVARAALNRASEEANADEVEAIGLKHLLVGILSEPESIATGVLESFGISLETIRQQTVKPDQGDTEQMRLSTEYQARYDATPTLNQLSRDLTIAALRGTLDPLIGREVELERTMQILSRRSKNNPVLLGPAGVGKTAIAEGLALRIIADLVPENLRKARVVALDVGLLAVGTKFRGDFEDRLKRIMQEILASPGIIIVIDELHSLVGTGVAEGSVDAANLFKPMLARGEFQCIGATTLDEYRKTIQADPALERRFQPVMVAETNAQETLEVLHGLRTRYAEFHHVEISDEALVAAVQLSSRYIQDRFQPDKAIDLIDEAASRVCVQRTIVPDQIRQLREAIIVAQREKEYAITLREFALAARQRSLELHLRRELESAENAWSATDQHDLPVVGEQDIARIVTMWTGVPVMQIASDEAEALLHLEDALQQRVIGQQRAVEAVARAVRRSRTNLRDRRRPIGSFIFVGPTGVGKTELARVLAKTLFGDEQALFKLDMSEFMERHNVSRLVGSPPGYIGHDRAGQLTEAVRRRPYSVILFDEVEKAHPSVFDLLLQVLEDGCLTDSHGKTVDFRNTILIITSNIGGTQLMKREASFFTTRQSRQVQHANRENRAFDIVMPALKDVFKPELLNRIDEIVLFHPLERDHLRTILDLMVKQVEQRLNEQHIALRVTERAREHYIERGYDVEYGARPLRRTVQRLLEDMLAEAILQGTLTPGDTVTVDCLEGEPVMHIQQAVPVSLHTGRDAA